MERKKWVMEKLGMIAIVGT